MKFLKVILFLLCSPAVIAANQGIPTDRKITELTVYENMVVVKFSPNFENSQNCTHTSKEHFQLNFNSETGENMALLSTLLAAASASKSVGFAIGGCAGQYPKIYRVNVKY